MEKGIPHCKLSAANAMIEVGKVHMTANAMVGGELLGFDRTGMVDVVLALTPTDFY
ncbi:MAG: type II toxin-antitoxin system MqsR family toxin [Acidithiobacillus sp.]